MGSIENYWSDVSIYAVGFAAKSVSDSTREFRKLLVFPVGITKEEVIHLIPLYFSNIKEVLYVDEFTDGLLLKEKHF